MSYAEAISQIATVCKNDIARYCKGAPLGPRLRACFDANAARMSPQCRAHGDRGGLCIHHAVEVFLSGA